MTQLNVGFVILVIGWILGIIMYRPGSQRTNLLLVAASMFCYGAGLALIITS